MTSPFPGMDPYLERHWLDVHTKLVTYAADALNDVLPDALVARTEERVAVGSAEDVAAGRGIRPDVRVFAPGPPDASSEPGGVAVDAPFTLVVDLDPVTERFVKILDASGDLVTVIEFVSPTNKTGAGLDAYRDKRGELLAAGVSLVEVDLVRAGNWRALLRPHACPPPAEAAYRVTVRPPPGAVAFLYPAPIQRRLPDVPVPLRAGDPRVTLPLQSLLDQAYARGRYARTIDYREPCDPPLTGDEATWADGVLKAAGRR